MFVDTGLSGVTDIANCLFLSKPAVSQRMRRLYELNYLTLKTTKNNEYERNYSISSLGVELIQKGNILINLINARNQQREID